MHTYLVVEILITLCHVNKLLNQTVDECWKISNWKESQLTGQCIVRKVSIIFISKYICIDQTTNWEEEEEQIQSSKLGFEILTK